MISQVDLCATLGKIVGAKSDLAASPDSRDLSPALFGVTEVGRDHIIEHANGLAIRMGHWKLIPGTAAPAKNAQTSQLYDLDTDLGETTNLADQHPEIVKQLKGTLERIRNGRDDD